MVQLREVLMRDAKLLVEYVNGRENREYSDHFPCNFRLSNAIELIKQGRDGKILMRAVDDGSFAGVVALVNVFRGRGELVIVMGEEHRGVLSEAVSLFLHSLRGVDLIYSFVASDDRDTGRALEENGFRKAGEVPGYVRNCFGEKLNAAVYFRRL